MTSRRPILGLDPQFGSRSSNGARRRLYRTCRQVGPCHGDDDGIVLARERVEPPCCKLPMDLKIILMNFRSLLILPQLTSSTLEDSKSIPS